jgi:hypothetical protein
MNRVHNQVSTTRSKETELEASIFNDNFSFHSLTPSKPPTPVGTSRPHDFTFYF